MIFKLFFLLWRFIGCELFEGDDRQDAGEE